MFEDGSMWRPPQMNPYSQGMPDELVDGSSGRCSDDHPSKKTGLTDGSVSVHILTQTHMALCGWVF